ncbi:RagB/SusD family nutrient uptake outer membrane protein [Chryseobacterium populi]|uniref:RagB/SusD family protein n=1 Tax=Chryseobacterium populi TaxID=1144316 RepID=J2T8G2_9FLAO|nr:RagB/SusD family nutrient uptake outer membrane protein [Chryseobacterium populi]EJL74382.1 RagB/SusD family protein [Chryseobacterium populi]
MKFLIHKLSYFPAVLCCVLLLSGCDKQNEFLQAKPDQALTIPKTLADLDLILNNEEVFNAYSCPSMGFISSDEYYLTTENYDNSWDEMGQKVYIFGSDIYKGGTIPGADWNKSYNQVFVANTVLEVLKSIRYSEDEANHYNEIKGTSLFFRAFAFYNLVQTFSLPYDSMTSSTDMGVPLRLNSDLTEKIKRASVKESYDQIIRDLTTAYDLLPLKAKTITKPSKVAVNAMLSRIYLGMGAYSESLKYAKLCLAQYGPITDYNLITPTKYSINSDFLAEDIFHTSLINYSIMSPAIPDSNIYRSYENNDLRKSYFFRVAGDGSLRFRGSYDARQSNKYCGVATDEIYLNRAECYAREGNKEDAMKDLNLLLAHRYKTGTFTPLTATTSDEALYLILEERKKELLFRGLRWTDLRRLNKEARFKKDVIHIVRGISYLLKPQSMNYAMLIPDPEIQLGGLTQNPRQ